MKKILTVILAVALMTVVAQAAAPTAEDVETTIETTPGVGLATTYLELTNNGGGTGDTKDGLTLVTATDQWGYPDGSDSDAFVNENCLDEDDWDHDPEGADDFLATISGLDASTDYELFVVSVGRSEPTEDFSWGTVADGSAVTNVIDVSNIDGAIQIGDGSGSNYDFAVPVGTFTSNASGEISIWLGRGIPYNTSGSETERTQLDGLVVGRAILKAWSPTPADNAGNVALNADLSWRIPTDANGTADTDWSYNMYFDTDSTFASTTPISVGPKVEGVELTVTNAQIGGPLSIGDYYWRVDSVDPNVPVTTRTGDLWSFAAGATLPTLISPPDDTNPTVEIDVDLEWSSDPLVDASKIIITPFTDPPEPPIDLGEQTSPFNPYADAGITMEWNMIYVWHVVELDASDNILATGPNWLFQVRPLNCDISMTADIDGSGDCLVNLSDFAAMASQWLDCKWDDGGKASPCP